MKKNNKKKVNSIRIKLFLTLAITLIIIIICLIVINSIILERFYIFSKEKRLIEAYEKINDYYTNPDTEINISNETSEMENNGFEILITKPNGTTVYMSNQNFIPNYMGIIIKREFLYNASEIYSGEKTTINQARDVTTGYNFIYLTSNLDNDYKLYIRVPLASIKESVNISNSFLQLMGCITLVVSGIIVTFISKKFTDPILQLNEVTNKMAKLDFTAKYKPSKSNDEIDNLGKNINAMSTIMENTIKQLKATNTALEKDIEKKSRTDEMRKQFISDVSHELKTPIALIQGYAEGLVENVANSEESRKFYAEVILDEANKMNILVKRLLELIKIEYGELEFNDKEFNVSELISEMIRKSNIMIEEKKVNIDFNSEEKHIICADEFYIEQIINNYFTNALKNVKEVNGEKEIAINIVKKGENTRISVFNTGDNIDVENIDRIWKRFYKVDESRNRDDGGTGIGLSLVKALMERIGKDYGVINRENGVEFYFEI